MDFDKLIELITKEVMKKLNKVGIELQSLEEQKILFLGSKEDSAYKVYEDGLSALGYKIQTTEEKENIKDYVAVIMPSLSIKELSNLALGLPNGLNEEIIIEAIMNGVPVYLREEEIEYKKYSNTANKVFFKMYIEYENKLKDFGINIKNTDNILNLIKEGKAKKKNTSVKSEENIKVNNIEEVNAETSKEISIENNVYTISSNRLISENDMTNLYRKGIRTVNVPKKALITPLAKDFARINHIEIIREK